MAAAAAAAPSIAPGHLGNLTQSQEAKLRALWAIGFKFIELYEADVVTNPRETLQDKYVPPAKKLGNQQQRRKKGKTTSSATHDKYPTLVKEVLSLMPTDEQNLEKLAREAVESLDHWTPDMYRLMVLRVIKHEHPDSLALRFLRACKWDLNKATKMMGNTIYWRTMEMAVDDDIMKHGDGGAAEDERNGQGLKRSLGADFMKQVRWGKGFIHGTDKAGRPICYIRIRLHKKADQSVQALERFTVYLLETARLSLRHPVETATIILDMTGFTLANLDLTPVKYLFKCLETNYPEALGLLIVHNAPFGAKTLWRLVRHWVSPVITSKTKFTYGRKGLQRYIARDQIIKELGGNEDWTYQYEEPVLGENIMVQNGVVRDSLLGQRTSLVERFEDLTKEWVMNAQGSEKAAEICAERDRLVDELAANYWELDPYVRARSYYDRQRYFRGEAGVEWYKDMLDEDTVMSEFEKVYSNARASHHEQVSDVEAESTYDYDTD